MLPDFVVEGVAQEAMLEEVKFEEAHCIDNEGKKTASGDLYAARRPEFLGTKGSALRRKTSETLEGPGLSTGVVGKRARDRVGKKRAKLYKIGCQDDIETVADDTGDWRQLHNGVGY